MLRTMLLAVGFMLSSSPAPDRPVGDMRVLVDAAASVPFPEGIAVDGDKFYVSGPAIFPTAGTPASHISVYDVRTGELLKKLVVKGQDLTQEHALSALTFDGAGRLYVIDTQQGILRFNVETGEQETYAGPLPALGKGTFPLPNDLTFDKKGWLYVTDSFQGAIWRIPPGGGAPKLWFHSPVLATNALEFGPNGIRVHPQRNEVWFAHTQSGFLYSLPLVDKPKASQLKVVHRYAAGEGPDGLAFAKSGKLYVTLAFSNQVSVLTPKGKGFEETRIGGTGVWDAPANVAFTDMGEMLVTNHAIVSRKAENFAVLSVFMKDEAVPLARPRLK